MRHLSIRLSLGASLFVWGAVAHGSELDAPLIGAVQGNQLQQVERFLEFGGSVALIDPLGFSLGEHAAAKGHTDMIHLLARNGADLTYADPQGNTALHMACREGHEAAALAIVSVLGHQVAHVVSHVNGKGRTPLHLVAERPTACPTLVHQFITHGANVDAVSPSDHTTPLWWASKRGHGEVVKSLLLAKANPEVGTRYGVTPLMIACYDGHTEVAQLLLTLGHADPNHATSLGITPLMVASYQGHSTLVDLLLHHKAAVHLASDPTLGGGKAYHYALKRGHFGIAQILHEAEHRRTQEQTDIQALKDELKRIQAQHEHLWGIHQSQIKDSASRYYLREDPSLRTFYETFSRKAIELFLAYKVLDTGMVEGTKEGGLYTAASGIELLGELIPLPGAGLITKGISAAMTHIADKREEAIVKTLASFTVFLHELDASIELAARNMTYCYEAPARNLTKVGAERLAEAGLRRFIEYAREGHLNPGEPLWVQLKEAIVYYEEKFFLFKTLYTFKSKELKIEPASKWTDEGIFRHTGIQVETGHRYINPSHRHHETYGFRLGREVDCERLGYAPLEEHPDPIDLPNASSSGTLPATSPVGGSTSTLYAPSSTTSSASPPKDDTAPKHDDKAKKKTTKPSQPKEEESSCLIA